MSESHFKSDRQKKEDPDEKELDKVRKN